MRAGAGGGRVGGQVTVVVGSWWAAAGFSVVVGPTAGSLVYPYSAGPLSRLPTYIYTHRPQIRTKYVGRRIVYPSLNGSPWPTGGFHVFLYVAWIAAFN